MWQQQRTQKQRTHTRSRFSLDKNKIHKQKSESQIISNSEFVIVNKNNKIARNGPRIEAEKNEFRDCIHPLLQRNECVCACASPKAKTYKVFRDCNTLFANIVQNIVIDTRVPCCNRIGCLLDVLPLFFKIIRIWLI